MGRFRRESHVFRTRDVLREDYQPESLEERGEKLDEYATALQPIIDGNQPDNIFLYGPTGVGKTAATHQLLTELRSDAQAYDDIDVQLVELNCTGLTSSYQVASNLVNEFRNPDHQLTSVEVDRDPIPETGYPQKRLMRELRKDLESVGGTIAIVLDEIDHIGSDDDILYELPRARKTYDLDAKLGIIGISNDYSFRDQLGARVIDTLCEEEITFPPYDATQLTAILEKRAEQAFHDDVETTAAVRLAAAYAARDRGSARQALDILRKAGDLAKREASENTGGAVAVDEAHVEEANQLVEQQQVLEGIRSLTQHAKLTLLTICAIEAREESPERTRVIHDEYQQVALANGYDPLKRRRIHDHLSNLDLNGILSQVDVSNGRGNKNYYELDISLESVFQVFEETASELEVQPIREHAVRKGLV
ncbi:orc1/cdc6 family replication initiation protein [Halobaculum lipolyticum]|uniref:ORC1-type DNA replication protein n=1 Tax=Halobaculum lipolyticum TaxID=3032001 RepID=A0ABD5WC30_9EURY